MSLRDDHPDEMTVPDPVLAEFLHDVHQLADVPAPVPSDELEALFASSWPLGERGRAPALSLRPLRRLLVPLAVAASVVALLVAGAATHELPAPAQRLISDVVNAVTPFHIQPDPRHVPSTPAPPPGRPRSPRRQVPLPQPSAGRSSSPRPTAGAPVPAHPSAPAHSTPPSSTAAPSVSPQSSTSPPGRSGSAGPPSSKPAGSAHGLGNVPVHAHPTRPATRTAPASRGAGDGGGRPAPPSPVPSASAGPSAHGKRLGPRQRLVKGAQKAVQKSVAEPSGGVVPSNQPGEVG